MPIYEYECPAHGSFEKLRAPAIAGVIRFLTRIEECLPPDNALPQEFRTVPRVSSFISRGVVLSTARLLNQALALLSPLLLVRMLDIVEYGRYRQFMATAMLITSLGGFALSANLNYLIARTPERAATDITKTTVLMMMVGFVSALIVAACRPRRRPTTP